MGTVEGVGVSGERREMNREKIFILLFFFFIQDIKYIVKINNMFRFH